MGEHESKVELLRNASIFAKLREFELDIIAKYSEYVQVPEKTIVFKQGNPAAHMFIVDQGEVSITRSLMDEETILAEVIQGESFGELDVLEGSSYSATAVTLQNSVMLCFPHKGKTFADILENHPDISALILHKFISIISDRIRHVNLIANEKSEWVYNLKKQLLSDKLTGMFNRIYLQEDFGRELPDYKGRTALLVVKPDNFKDINDNFGHETGDNVLQLIAIFFQSVLGEYDIAVRYRGDELIAILPDSSKEKALHVARDMLMTFKEIELSHIINVPFTLTASIGVAMYPGDTNNLKKLIGTAYQKMFLARESGGDKIFAT